MEKPGAIEEYISQYPPEQQKKLQLLRENERTAREKADKKTRGLRSVMARLKKLGNAQTKKTYQNHGAREPLFGVTTTAMKPLAREIKRDYELSKKLYATGNYDAMYLAGIIAEPSAMTQADLEAWMERAYCHGLSDYVVAVVLAQTPFGQELADRWIARPEELYQSAGWSCYGWMLGYLPDSAFDREKLRCMLEDAAQSVHEKQNWVRYAVNGFVIALGISYLPLHEEALAAAAEIGRVTVDMGPTSCRVPPAYETILQAREKGRLGFKRKKMYC